MYLRGVEGNPEAAGPYAELVRMMRAHGANAPQIMHLFAFKPDVTRHLDEFTHAVMRGPSPLSAGLRELIAAFTSRGNECEF